MNNDLLIIITSICIGFIVIFIFLNQKLKPKNTSDTALLEWLKSMQQSIDLTNKNLNDAMRASSNQTAKILQENSKQLNERLDRAATVIKEVGNEVGQMSEIGRSMKELQEFLKSPKLRGNIGEHILNDLIAQMFPKNSFYIQYQFKTGDRVDAAIKTDAGILPIDSKFPMDNFQKMLRHKGSEEEFSSLKKDFARDVKKHIDDISKKYILPDEGTMDFALMYVPSESIYYEIVNIPEIMNHAKQNRVYIVSPSTLYAHLQTILLAFEGQKIESRSKEIFKLLRTLQIEYAKINENIITLGKHLNNASSQYSSLSTNFTSFGDKLSNSRSIGDRS